MVVYVPPCDLLMAWLDRQPAGPDGRILILYDELLDVLKGYLGAVPVDSAWYLAEYPAVAAHIGRTPGETARSHFVQHGYFEGRRPFADGWEGHRLPVPFDQLKPLLRVSPNRGRLVCSLARDEVVALVRRLLRAVPVDEAWYRRTYPAGRGAISASSHYAEAGYFAGLLPADIEVDATWYLAHYPHAQRGLGRGLATDAKDHFFKLGYREGCRPIPLP